MAEVDLDKVKKLFEQASNDGVDKAKWANKFTLHTSNAMAKQKTGMPEVEVLSLQFDMLTIVEERLDARCAKHEEILQQTMREFHQEWKRLFDAALRLAGGVQDSGKKMSVPGLDLKLAQSENVALDNLDLQLDDDEEESFSGSDEDYDPQDEMEFTGVASFVALAKKPAVAVPRPADGRNQSIAAFFHDDSDDDDEDDVEDDLMRTSGSTRRFRTDSVISGHDSLVTSKYTKIHTDCKARLFSALDVDKPEKAMTVGQLREIMSGCIQMKKEMDEGRKANHMQAITMENYLYEFLEKRYNSNDEAEIREWFIALSKSITKFSTFDSDICIFGKMLRNSLPESFPDQQKVLRNTAEKMMREELPASIWSARMYNGIPLKTFEKVVYHMFNQKDGHDIMKRVKDPLQRGGKGGAAVMEALAREYVRFQHAMETMMCFNMNLQDDFLADFVQIFRKIDAGKDGTISSNEITLLINRMASTESVKEGTASYLLLENSKASALRTCKRSRRLTFSEAADMLTDLVSARWSVLGKKGTRFNVHENLKNQLAAAEAESKAQKKEESGSDQLKGVLKRIRGQEKLAEATAIAAAQAEQVAAAAKKKAKEKKKVGQSGGVNFAVS